MNYDSLKTQIELAGVHAELGQVGNGWGIEQNPHELATFLAALPSDIHTVLEIGTGYRAGLARFLTVRLAWKVTTLNLWPPHTAALLARQFIGDSSDPDVIRSLQGDYDLVIIDADHQYESVRQDYDNYADMGRVVMLHDIAGLRDCQGVAQFWREIAYTKNGTLRKGYHEVIDSSDYRAGIGWIIK